MSDDVKWAAIPGYEGFFEASDTGLIRSLDRVVSYKWRGDKIVRRRIPGHLVATCVGKGGYLRVALCRDGHHRPHLLHRLVLAAFAGPSPEPGMDACHRDGSRTNNALSNLYWGTRTQNVQDMVRHGTAHWQQRTTCPSGHEYTLENALQLEDKRGWKYRMCRTCKAEHAAKYRANQRERGIALGRYGAKYGNLTTRPLDPAKCGTNAQREAHRRRGEKPCQPCQDAHREYQRARREARRSA